MTKQGKPMPPDERLHVVVINKTEKENDMKVKYICRECGKTPCEITLDNGDTPTHCIVAASKCPWQRAETQPAQEPKPKTKIMINNLWRGKDWDVVGEEKQHTPEPKPKPELMTGLQARCKVFAQGGGEIWFEAEGKTPEHRVTIGADCVVTKGTANGLTETQKVYTVRPLPLATVAT